MPGARIKSIIYQILKHDKIKVEAVLAGQHLLRNNSYRSLRRFWDDLWVSVWFDLHKDKNASVTSQYSLVHMTGVTLFSEWELKKHLNVRMYTFSKFLSNTFHHFLYFTRSCFYYFFLLWFKKYIYENTPFTPLSYKFYKT